MELKEAILQTLAEIDTNAESSDSKPAFESQALERDALLDVLPSKQNDKSIDTQSPYTRKIEKLEFKNTEELKALLSKHYLEEEKFLNALQERILVLFEGLQSPNNRNIESKVDMVLNFLEYTLAIIDEKKNKK
ncbi:CiaD-like domain-containing protein [Helicobacter turcicus]|uniref:Campylobacter invasion antigen D C-terminal domain-containing protein n=1 Tax=Helicobacter turcicus TaxID=2867412 RepID=A0ABS7JNS1_9HELI|nr:hypothetical protein [Helicobacter turcicus]MBX7491046.1 hypothetical protein [Helicobacter turcicus]MBX7546307.1 hypothetical protein [Helicobacter turcicus]